MFDSSRTDPYIIAEVGQNHQGSVEEAMRYISVFSSLGASAVKFQMRSNSTLFDSSVYNSIYNSDNSFGETYGEHREFLELTSEEFRLLRDKCSSLGVDFIVTPFDEVSLETCLTLGVDAIKIASFDVGNIPFIEKIAKSNVPIVISTGGANLDHISSSINVINKYHKDVAILHCVSKYPCPLEDVQLLKINILKDRFPGFTIGLSDHFNGIITGPLAYTLGALVFEKHVTFNRCNKGSDHSFSLEPEGFRKFCRDIHRSKVLLTEADYEGLGSEPVFKKLGKSLVANDFIPAGAQFTTDNLSGRICRPSIIPVRESAFLLGKFAAKDINRGDYITYSDVV